MIDNLVFIRNAFSRYYSENIDRVEIPKSIENREFGFTLFKEGVMVRHKGFMKPEDLKDFIKKNIPSNVFYSAAYYSVPEAKMDEKGWLGSDLFFDIDADHIPTKCNKKHDVWTCRGCGLKGRGMTPDKCPTCGGESFDDKTWPCEICLETARSETIKLIDMLMNDFGFSPEEIKCSFSGHRGYHVQIESEGILDLDSDIRKEIVDYITGTGIDALLHGLEEVRDGKTRFLVGPSLDDFGWRGRIAKGTYEFLLAATENDLRNLGLKRKIIEKILSSRDEILESWKTSGPWNLVEGLGLDGWQKILQHSATFQSAKIDTVVTVDIHRLIRLPGTLHGKTGLLKVSFPVSRIEDFDPLKEALALKGEEVKVYVDEAPAFRLGDEIFGPFEKQSVTLPLPAAVFLLCKNAAKVID
ncbi:MAG: DNA primase small subunit PriS [Thermoproteota archaeon]|nr:DNA primase small subunit PriS [Candidatus Bathyarchaeota archaeon]